MTLETYIMRFQFQILQTVCVSMTTASLVCPGTRCKTIKRSRAADLHLQLCPRCKSDPFKYAVWLPEPRMAPDEWTTWRCWAFTRHQWYGSTETRAVGILECPIKHKPPKASRTRLANCKHTHIYVHIRISEGFQEGFPFRPSCFLWLVSGWPWRFWLTDWGLPVSVSAPWGAGWAPICQQGPIWGKLPIWQVCMLTSYCPKPEHRHEGA